MKSIYLKRRKIDSKDYLGRSATEELELVDYPATIYDKDTGKMVAIYNYLQKDYSYISNQLGMVKFSKNIRTSGLVTQSEIIGYRPRLTGSIGKKTCSKTVFGEKYYSTERALYEVAKEANAMYFQYSPEVFRRHKEMSEKVLGQYIIEDTNFTSGIINKNNPLKYHLDSGNFRGVYSMMLGLKNDITGGHLNIPEYGISLEIANNTISMFDGQDLVHGVTPITKLSDNANRFTIVFYSLVQMWSCGTTQEEIDNARVKEEEKIARLLERVRNANKKT